MLELIKELIERKGLTIAAVERELGFGNGSIKRWNTNMPSVDKALLLANFLKVSLDYLVTGKQPEQEQSEQDAGIGLYLELDDIDRAEVRGEMRQMLKSDKYKKRDTNSHTSIA